MWITHVGITLRPSGLPARMSCCHYADALRERNGHGYRAKATSLLEESLAFAKDLGIQPLMERLPSRREILRA